ncbi:MAG: helix-turn-helix domain-containing protein, partial [Rhodomicrobium sp.]
VGQSLCDHHTYAAEAATDAELCCYPRGSFDSLMKSHLGLSRTVFRMKLRELDSSRDLKFLLSRKCAYFRVAGFLLMIATRTPTNGAGGTYTRFQLPLTRGEIADYLGLTLETVSREFSRLKGARVIDLPSSRMVVVQDMELLRRVANGAQAECGGE